jgi:NAD(P)-dependent dehydrogenase (short-subunit alcohol dehydrogenase family)
VTARAHIVVGGTSGLGHAAARVLTDEGHRVVLVGRDSARAEGVAEAIGAMGEGSDRGGLEAALRRAVERLGGLDGIAVTAGPIVACAAYSIRAPKPVLLHYAAMKAAIAVFIKGVAKAHGSQGIRANCIAPGAFATEALDATRAALDGADDLRLWQEMRDTYGMKAALDRIGEPREAGELIAFLLSEKAAYLTGALINIDGGTDF